MNLFELMEFFESLNDDKRATYIFISLGSDEENVKIAANMRMLWKRRGIEPVNYAVVMNATIANAIVNANNFRHEEYNIDCIGDIHHEYSENVIINSELESKSLERHLKWDPEESFWAYEYNYNSSAAPIIHFRTRDILGIYDIEILKQ